MVKAQFRAARTLHSLERSRENSSERAELSDWTISMGKRLAWVLNYKDFRPNSNRETTGFIETMSSIMSFDVNIYVAYISSIDDDHSVF